MSVRKTKLPAPVTSAPFPADDAPATAGMLRHVRAELFDRIDQSERKLRGEMHEINGKLREEMGAVTRALSAEISSMGTRLGAEIQGVKSDVQGVKSDIQGVKSDIQGVKSDIQGVKSDIDGLKAQMQYMQADLHGVKAEIAHVAFLVEEQNARNKVVFDALTTFLDRQTRVEERMDGVEATVRDLAGARSKT